MGARRLPTLLALAFLLLLSSLHVTHADFDVSGTCEYEDRQYTIAGFGGTLNRPIRFADVEVADVTGTGNTVLAQGATDASGSFSITNVTAGAAMDIEVRCIASTSQTADLDIEVRDEPNNIGLSSIWAIVRTFPAHGPTTNINFTATPAVAAVHETTVHPAEGDGPGGAFNIFDVMVRGSDFVKGLNGGLAPGLVRGHWAPGDNTPEATSYFQGSDDRLFILGIDADRDEYDDPVVAHEYGHAVEHLFWQARSPGGSHGLYGHYDPRLALSEGYGNYFSSAIRGEDFYVDMNAAGVSNDFSLETGGRYNYNAFGSDSEVAVQMLLWDIADAADDDNDCLGMGHDEIWDVFDNYVDGANLAKTIEDFYDGWTFLGHPMATQLKQAMNSRLMQFVANPHTRIYENDFIDTGIPDNDPAGLTRSIVVADDLTLNAIPSDGTKQQSFSVAAFVELDHDEAHTSLRITLEHPDGTQIVLFDQGAGGDANSNNVHFTRDGVYAWFGLTSGIVELNGQAWLHPIPNNALSGLDGKALAGTWKLKVADLLAGDTGTFRAWRLLVTPADWYDAPDSYGTDAWHRNTLYEWLGPVASHEAGVDDTRDTDPQDNHDPEDTDDQDDGVTFTADVVAGKTVQVDVEVSTVGAKSARYLDDDETGKRPLVVRGWFDWDQDGDFKDPEERVIDWSESPQDWAVCEDSKTVSLSGTAPEGALGGTTWARFRLGYDSAPGPKGVEEFGEVEDYAITFGEVKLSFHGTAEGGTIDLTVNGVNLTVTTTAGQTAEQVATAVAAAINGDSTLNSQGVTATAVGNQVCLNGTVNSVSVNDNGLTHDNGCEADGGTGSSGFTASAALSRLVERYVPVDGDDPGERENERGVPKHLALASGFDPEDRDESARTTSTGSSQRAEGLTPKSKRRDRGAAASAFSAGTSLSASIDGSNVLRVVGSSGNDEIELRLMLGDPTMLEVEDLATAFVFPAFAVSGIDAIDVSAGDGNDLVFFNDANGVVSDVPDASQGFNIDGGSGENTIVAGSGGQSLASVLNILTTLQSANSLLSMADGLIQKAGAVDPLGNSGTDAISLGFELVQDAYNDVVVPATTYLRDIHDELIVPASDIVSDIADPNPGGHVFDSLQLMQDAYDDLVFCAYCVTGGLCGIDTTPQMFEDNKVFALKDKGLEYETRAAALQTLALEFDQGGSKCTFYNDENQGTFIQRMEDLRHRLELVADQCFEPDDPDIPMPYGDPSLRVDLPDYCRGNNGGAGAVDIVPGENDVFDFQLRNARTDVNSQAATSCDLGMQAIVDCMEREIHRYDLMSEQCVADADAFLAVADGLNADAEAELVDEGDELVKDAELLALKADTFLTSKVDPLEASLEAYYLQAEFDLDAAGQNMRSRGEAEIDLPAQLLASQAQLDFDGITSDIDTLAANLIVSATSLIDSTVALLEGGSVSLGGGGADVGDGCSSITTTNTISGSGPFFIGSSGNDLITGTSGLDIMVGLGGEDIIHGLDGTDLIFGGSGRNELHGGNGIDLIFGGADKDCMFGEGKIDLMIGFGGADEMDGGDNTDVMLGLAGDDLMLGGPGLDVMLGGLNDDVMDGQGCIDVMLGNPGNDTMSGGPGYTLTVGSLSLDIGDVMFGMPGNDTMHGDDTANTGEGIDVMFGGAGADQMFGARGGVLEIGSFMFRLGNVMFGGDQDDVVRSKDGVDVMFGGADNDTMSAGTGDTLSFSSGSFTLELGDLMFGNPGDDIMDGDSAGGSGIDVMFGGPGVDVMQGEDGGDLHTSSFDVKLGNVMFGQAGDDDVRSKDGICLLFGGADNDRLSAGNGFQLSLSSGSFMLNFGDLVFGSEGNDTIYGDEQSDSDASVDDGIDLLFGGSGSDQIYAGSGGDLDLSGFQMEFGNLIFGSSGDDGLFAHYELPAGDEQDGIDLMFGGRGNDTMAGSEGGDIVIGGTTPVFRVNFGNLMFGSQEDDIMTSGDGFDLMFGGSGNDTMTGGPGDDPILGDGIDLMFGSTGQDIMKGGHGGQIWIVINGVLVPIPFGNLMFGGDDEDDVESKGRILDIDLLFANDCDDTVRAGQGLLDLSFGNKGNDEMDGEQGIDLMFGNRGADVMRGGPGIVDLMFGNEGRDIMDGEQDINLMFGNSDDDQMTGGGGIIDLMFGNKGHDVMSGGNGLDVMFGNRGNDIIDGGDGLINLLFGNRDADDITGGSGLDLIFGNSGQDEIDGMGGLDLLFGNSDSDVVRGGSGLNLIFGNDSGDVLEGGSGLDLIFGNEGQDKISGGGSLNLLFGNSDNDALFGGTGLDLMFGNGGSDWLYGSSSLDLMFGNDGIDTLYGEAGTDLVFGNDDGDRIIGGPDKDLLFGNRGNDEIYGDDAREFAFGNRGEDTLVGAADGDRDYLFGNRDNDTLYKCPSPNDRMFGGFGSDTKNSGCTSHSFGNVSCGTIKGRKVDDTGAPLAGVTVYLDLNADDMFQSNEPFRVTSGSGHYNFGQLGPGNYDVREVPPVGFNQLPPIEHVNSITFNSSVTNPDFVNEDVCVPLPDGTACASCPCAGQIVPTFANVCDTDGSSCLTDNDCPCDGQCVSRVVQCDCVPDTTATIVVDGCVECGQEVTFLVDDPDGAPGTMIVHVLDSALIVDTESTVSLSPIDPADPGNTLFVGGLPVDCSGARQDEDGVLQARPGDVIRITYFDPPNVPITVSVEVREICPLDETEPNDDCLINANPVGSPGALLNDTFSASIEPACDTDAYKIGLDADTYLVVETSGDGDPACQLLDCASGAVLACDDDSGPSLESRIEGCVPAGDYCVRCRGGAMTTFDYEIEFTGTPGCLGFCEGSMNPCSIDADCPGSFCLGAVGGPPSGDEAGTCKDDFPCMGSGPQMVTVDFATTGSHLISLPAEIVNPTVVDADDLLDALAASSLVPTFVARYVRSTDGFEAYTGATENNFAIVPGEAYLVGVGAPGALILEGVDSHIPIDLLGPGDGGSASGNQAISLPFSSSLGDAADLLADIGPTVVNVSRYVTSTGGFQVYDGTSGTPFPIVSGEGYLARVAASTTYVPSSAPDPPNPDPEAPVEPVIVNRATDSPHKIRRPHPRE